MCIYAESADAYSKWKDVLQADVRQASASSVFEVRQNIVQLERVSKEVILVTK